MTERSYACASCGLLLVLDEEKNTSKHEWPPCAAYLAACKAATFEGFEVRGDNGLRLIRKIKPGDA